ncbi:MAG: TrmB family transcriptional regulator [Candidatus Hodarchaeales archaeon]|jgi:sugar-specific transcriptional regulator TrmB
MNVDESLLLDDLSAIGLTKNEGKVLIALVKLNRSVGVSKIASESGVPRSKIYQALEGLQEKNLVTMNEIRGSANTYRLILGPPEIVSHLQQTITHPIEKAAERSSENLLKLKNTIEEEDIGIDELWLIKGLDSIIRIAKEMIDSANITIISNLFPSYLRLIAPNLVAAKKRKVQVKLANLDEERNELSKTIHIDSISTENTGISIQKLKNFSALITSFGEEESFSSEELTSSFKLFLSERPNFLLIDPDTENAAAILILMDTNNLANSSAVQTRNQNFIRSIDRLVNLVLGLATSLKGLLDRFGAE